MTILLNPLEHFHTKTPSVKVRDNCGFRYAFHKISLYSQSFESTRSFQLSMRPIHLIPFQWSITGLDITKTTRIYELCQGKFYLFHSLGFQQLKHMVSYSLNSFHIDFWNIKVPKTITLDNENRRRFTRMHTIFLCNFSRYAPCDSPNTPFLLSRWISILIIERHSSRISFLNFEDKNLFSFYNRLTLLLPCKMSITYARLGNKFSFYNIVQMLSSYSLLNPKLNPLSLNVIIRKWFL
jgi:hypothetical protein